MSSPGPAREHQAAGHGEAPPATGVRTPERPFPVRLDLDALS